MKSKVGLEREKIDAPSEAHPEVNDQFFVTYLIHLVGGHFFEKRFSLITIRISSSDKTKGDLQLDLS
jgi:hypothetical protein